MMKDIISEYTDKPESIPTDGGFGKVERYEEDNFIRLMLTKKDKHKQKQKKQLDEFERLADYADIAKLQEDDGHEEVDPSTLLRKKSMKQVINQLKNKKNGKDASGDRELPFREKRKAEEDIGGDDVDDDFIGLANDDDDGEDDFYKQSKQMSKLKKQKREPSFHYKENTLPDGQKRSITRQIENNRGLTKQRSKDTKNPRKKFRVKYENKLKSARGLSGKMVDKSRPYQGETTGIKTNVVRSRTFK